MKNISVSVVVYNEEKRIEKLLRSVQWSDDIIVVDKSSTDRTREIAEKYHAKVISVPYSDNGDEVKYTVSAAKNEWIMTLTASDMVHPELAEELIKIINQDDFDYDIISMPFCAYTLGISHKRSPWYFPLKKWMFKTAVFRECDVIHCETKNLASKKIYKMKKDPLRAIHHFTHQSVDSFLERHVRYTKAEVQKFKSMRQGLWRTTGEIGAALLWMTFYKKTWLMGWRGIMLMLAFLSYFFMKFMYIFEHFYGTGSEKYQAIQDDILAQCEKEK